MKTIEVCTDLAQIGLWDSSSACNSLSKLRYNEYRDVIEQKAQSGELFFIDTDGDGFWNIGILIEGSIENDSDYKKVDGHFELSSPSQKITLSGLEDYGEEPDLDSEFIFELPFKNSKLSI